MPFNAARRTDEAEQMEVRENVLRDHIEEALSIVGSLRLVK